jgi:hypothetical protein
LLSAHAASVSSATDQTAFDDNFPLPSISGDMFVPRIDEGHSGAVTHFEDKYSGFPVPLRFRGEELRPQLQFSRMQNPLPSDASLRWAEPRSGLSLNGAHQSPASMQLRSIVLTAAILAGGARAAAQDVRVEVVEAATGKPIVGANVALLDSAAVTPLGGGFSDLKGRTDLRAPARGPYRVRADKVGYDSWTSVQLNLGDKPVYVRVGMAPTRIPAPIMPRSETACQELTGPGTPAGDLWVELKKALTANAMTEAQGLVPLDVDLYERVLDRNLSIVSERAEQRTRITRRPATGISWDQLDSARRGVASNNDVYRAPDAATILSDQFVKSHCYAAIRGYGPESGLTGLEFKPARIAGQPELTGVLWLDPKANALRSLSFDYVNLPIPLRIARTTGRVEFQQLAGGQWIVPRWYIRMPRITRVNSTNAGAPAISSDTLIGYQEVGGAARPAGTAPVSTGDAAAPSPPGAAGIAGAPGTAGALAADSPRGANQSLLTGIVYDSTTGRPLRGVQVSTSGGRFKTLTTAGGAYELVIDGALNDTIVFDHPRLRLFHIAERVQTISMPAGARGQASVIIPSFVSLRKSICGQNETRTEAQGFMAGYVRDAAGKPIPRAHVWATWQVLWVEQNGRLVSTNQQRTVETDSNSDGSYMMCGFTRSAQITVKVDMAGKSPVQETLAFPATMVLEHDFQFGAR